MTTYQWLCLLGIPSIISVLGGMIIAQWKQIKAIREGIRALLRDRLLQVQVLPGPGLGGIRRPGEHGERL